MDHGAFAVFQGLDVAELYARAYNGRSSRRYKAAMQQNAGRIEAAGLTRDVTFESSDNQVNHQIDDAYRAKYKSSPYLGHMVGPTARAATVRIAPRAIQEQSQRENDK